MRHKHRLNHYRLLTGNMGELLPAGLVEVLPGDVFNHSASTLVRLSPMAAPVMHPMTVRTHHFFVPHRLSWVLSTDINPGDTFEDFITGGADGNNTQTVPQTVTTGVQGDLLDYLGLPTTAADIAVSALPMICYNMIWNEFYRDQDLGTLRDYDDKTIGKVSWEKDYFTTARPFAQKGEDVTLPLGTAAPIASENFTVDGGAAGPAIDGGAPPIVDGYHRFPVGNMFTDLSEATAAKVNDIRRAFALQRFAEVRARFGSRYPEYLRYLGVNPSDARLDRPEFLGGGANRVSISEVLQTAETTGAGEDRFGVGDMYGHGVGVARSNAYRRKFREHGYVMTLLSIRPKLMFSNGIERTHLRTDREDFWQKELQYIGQQQVMQQEVYADDTNADTVFGYSDRYQEYRDQRSLVTAEFRDTLDYWHLARQFDAPPVLNSDFTDCDPSKRIFNEQTQDSLWMACNHKLIARRLVDKSAAGKIF